MPELGVTEDRPTVRKTATVTPARPVDGTVSRRVRGKDRRPRSSPVLVSQVHPLVWSEAQRLCTEGSYSRVEVVDRRTVVVR